MILEEVRARYPQYANVPDDKLANALYKKFYAGKMTRDEFDKQAGLERANTGAARTILDQALQGATFGFADEIQDAGTAGALALYANLTGNKDEAFDFKNLYRDARGISERDIGAQQEERPVTSALAQIGGGLVTSGAGASTAAGKTALSRLGNRGLGARFVAGSGLGGASGAAYGAGAGFSPEERALNALAMGGAGVVLGGAGNVAAPLVKRAPQAVRSVRARTRPPSALHSISSGQAAATGQASRAINPFNNIMKDALATPVSDAKKRVVSLAEKHGVPLGLDDLTDSRSYKTLISEGQNLPFSGASDFVEKQHQAFTKAAAKSIGLDDVDRLTPENMLKAYNQIGKQFDDLTKGKTFAVNDDVLQSLDDIREVAASGGYGEGGERVLDRYLKELYATIDESGTVTGESLSRLRSKLNKVSRQGRDPNATGLAQDLENAIAEFITDGAPEKLRKAKYQYKNFITLEPLTQNSTIEGYIPPAQLLNRVRQVYKRQFTTGKAGELGDLAEVGQLIKQDIPNSGTPQRQAAQAVLGQGNIEGIAGLGSGFINPALPIIYAGVKGGGLALNRRLQRRNYDPQTIKKALGMLADTQ